MNDIINENDFDEFEEFQIKYEELTQLCTDEEVDDINCPHYHLKNDKLYISTKSGWVLADETMYNKYKTKIQNIIFKAKVTINEPGKIFVSFNGVTGVILTNNSKKKGTLLKVKIINKINDIYQLEMVN